MNYPAVISEGASRAGPSIAGLAELWAETLGDPRIVIAVLDGPVDRSHSCFAGARLTNVPTLVSETAGAGRMSAHGTHIASMIFGQPGSPVQGIAPGCRGVIVPIFSDDRPGPASQLDLARAVGNNVSITRNGTREQGLANRTRVGRLAVFQLQAEQQRHKTRDDRRGKAGPALPARLPDRDHSP